MTEEHHALVLLDPSSEVGERSLDYALERLSPTPTEITLFVALTGVTAQSLRDFATFEEVELPVAAQSYLDQLKSRVESAERVVFVVSSLGIDLAADIAEYGSDRAIGAVVVPARVARLDPGFVPRVATLMDIPVIVVPSVH